MNVHDKLHGFTVTGVKPVPETDATLITMSHDKTGARLLWLKNQEENKLFSIAFKTTPKDSTGVFHILEHSVLGGSKKYPVKEPFLELMKSSMNTFLNAMTFPDKTVFPVSSRNDADFMNLTRVYLDAVFCPAIYDNPGIFRQEGWHIELRKAEDEPLYKGVVFNEMKGAMSSVYRRIGSELERMLFPDTCYGFNSGGDPAVIPSLSYEQFLDNHREFYHPSNAYIYLDGPVDIERVLQLIDEEYLSRYERSDALHEIPMQAPIRPVQETAEYEIAAEEPEDHHVHLALGKVLASWREREKIAALSAIAEVLAGSNDAPLTRALLDTGLCRDVSMGVEDGVLQPFGLLEIHNTEKEHVEALLDTVKRVVSEQVEKGIDRDDLAAALNRMEFKERKGDEPKGLFRNITMLSSWLYGGDPLLYLGCDKLYAFLRSQLTTDYYEKLLSEWLLEETGRATLVMLPSRDYGQKLRDEETARLKTVEAGWTQADKQRVMDENRALDEWQHSVDTPEQLATMPVLPLSEVSDQPLSAVTEEDREQGVTLLRHPAQEKGILNLSLYFSLADCPKEQLSALSSMASLLSNLPTQKKDGPTLQRQIKAILGGIQFSVDAFGKLGAPEVCKPYFVVRSQFLQKNREEALALIAEILTETDFGRKDLVKEILLQSDEGQKQGIIGAGHRIAMGRARAGLSAEAAVKELTGGFENYRWQHELTQNLEDRLPAFLELMQSLSAKVFVSSRLTASLTGGERESIKPLLDRLPEGKAPECVETAVSLDLPDSQGILIPAPVSYSGYALKNPVGNLPVWNVASTVLSLEYLWNEVRVKGGAYGAGAVVNRLGEVSFYSYRDPAAAGTLATDRKAGEFLRQFSAQKPSLDRYIISTIGSSEPLMADDDYAAYCDALWMRGVTEQERKSNRKQMLRVTAEDLSALSKELDGEARLCVVGSQQAMDACADENLTVESI